MLASIIIIIEKNILTELELLAKGTSLIGTASKV